MRTKTSLRSALSSDSGIERRGKVDVAVCGGWPGVASTLCGRSPLYLSLKTNVIILEALSLAGWRGCPTGFFGSAA